MSMSDCGKCWETPCVCGYDYQHLDEKELTRMRDMFQGLLDGTHQYSKFKKEDQERRDRLMPHSHEIRIACEILNSFKCLGRDGVVLEFLALKQLGVHGVLCRTDATGRIVFLKSFDNWKATDAYMVRMAETHKQLGA